MATWRNWENLSTRSVTNGQFSALGEGYVGPENFTLQTSIELDHVLEDSLIAYEKRERTRLRIWNGVLQKVEAANIFLRILSSRFQSQSTICRNVDEPCCLSIFGMKVTKKGILACGPKLLQSTDSDGISHKVMCQKQDQKFAHYSTSPPARKSQRRLDLGVKMEVNECNDWELVYSQGGAISGFHLDSSGSGRLLHIIKGVKILCACPCSPCNWQVFKQYYKNMHNLQE